MSRPKEDEPIRLLEDFIEKAEKIFPADRIFPAESSRDMIYEHMGARRLINYAYMCMKTKPQHKTFSEPSKDEHTEAKPINPNDDPMGAIAEEVGIVEL